MEVRRTVEIKLEVGDRDATLLHETIDEFLWAANYVVDEVRDDDWIEVNPYVLHERTYAAVRNATRLHSNHVQSARNSAVAALKSVITKWSKGRNASLPRFTSRFCEYNLRNATFYDDHASLSSVGGPIKVEYSLPADSRDTPFSKYLFSPNCDVTGATLLYRDGQFFLHVRIKANVGDPERPKNGTVLGVDLGVKNIAVSSTGSFWSASELNHWRTEYAKRRRSLQRCGTRNAHENITAVGRKEKGRCRQLLHRVANEIIDEADELGCSYIVFEDLTAIRSRIGFHRQFNEWAFRRLHQFTRYKAEERGISVRRVAPDHTSQRCSTCGYIDRRNRPTQDTFRCIQCGYQNHADYNAAKNIGLRFLRQNQTGSDGGAPVGVRLNTGMMTVNGIVPVPESVSDRARVHGENLRH